MIYCNDLSLRKSLLSEYFRNLVNHFFKILPMRENEETSLVVYLESLKTELLGLQDIVIKVDTNPMLVTLISVVQFFIANPECDIKIVKREVFRAISICEKLSALYASSEV